MNMEFAILQKRGVINAGSLDTLARSAVVIYNEKTNIIDEE